MTRVTWYLICLLAALPSSQVPGAAGPQPKSFLPIHVRNEVAGCAARPDQHRPDHHHWADGRSHAWTYFPCLRWSRHLLRCPGQSLGWGITFAPLSPSYIGLGEACRGLYRSHCFTSDSQNALQTALQ